MRRARSSTATRLPRFPASTAHMRPAAPPPRMMTSNSSYVTISDVRVLAVIGLAQVNESRREDRSRWRLSPQNADERIANGSHEAPLGQSDVLQLHRRCTCGHRLPCYRLLKAALEFDSVIRSPA